MTTIVRPIESIFALLLLPVFFIVLSAASAQADETTKMSDLGRKEKDWHVSIGLGAMMMPEFEGSNKYEVKAIPLLNIRYKDRFFLSPSEGGIGVYIVREPLWNMGLAVGYNPGRQEKDSDLLKGMGDINSVADVKFFVECTPAAFTARLEAIKSSGDVKGLQLTASIGHQWRLTDDLQWKNSISSTYATADYNKTFFGISEKQSRESRHRYNQYTPGGGIKDIAYSSSFIYMFQDHWAVMLMGQYKLLTGPAADSPLVEAGSKDQFSGCLGLLYSF